jgi:hypothetical protein
MSATPEERSTMTTITDETIGTGQANGVVDSDLAEDTEPDYAGMTDDERQAAFEALVEEGVDAAEASTRVWGETDGEPAQKPVKPMQLPLPGTFEGISTNPGGSAPTVSEARLLGGSLPIEGEFEGEEFVHLLVTAKVNEVGFVYTTDDWGNTTVVKRATRCA